MSSIRSGYNTKMSCQSYRKLHENIYRFRRLVFRVNRLSQYQIIFSGKIDSASPRRTSNTLCFWRINFKLLTWRGEVLSFFITIIDQIFREIIILIFSFFLLWTMVLIKYRLVVSTHGQEKYTTHRFFSE